MDPSDYLTITGTTPGFLVNVVFKGLKFKASGLESTLTGIPLTTDSKGVGRGDHGPSFWPAM
jgi:hypothetical protein